MEPEHHPHPLAGRQTRSHRPGRHDRRGTGQPRGDLVVQPHRHDRRQLPADGAPAVPRTRHRPHRLRGLRLRPPTRSTIEITTSNLDGINAPQGGGPVRAIVKAPTITGAWILSSHAVDASGHAVDTIPLSSSGACAPSQPQQGISACFAEIKRLGYRQQVTYQPSSRFWPFQWYETGIYTALALGLAGFCFWRIRQSLS